MRSPIHSICPYFAMFPETFAETNIRRFTSKGDFVFDPFSGRGTTLFQALLMGRKGVATDTNPVAFCITGAKAHVPALRTVLQEIARLRKKYEELQDQMLDEERRSLPPFFQRAFSQCTLNELLFLRRALDWRHKFVHRFIAAMALGSLHGEMDGSSSYFSNQMPRTISPKPNYSLEYWQRNNLWPPERNVFQLLKDRATMRLGNGAPEIRGRVALGDARTAASVFHNLRGKIKAVITSPPYFDVTNAEEDQWLRLWFLGYEPRPTYRQLSRDDRHRGKKRYWEFLEEVWLGIAPLVQNRGTLICRIGAKNIEPREIEEFLLAGVRKAFPKSHLLSRPIVSHLTRRQTDTFRPGTKGCLFEIDYRIDLSR